MNTYGLHITNDSIAAHHAWVFPKYNKADVTDETVHWPEDPS